ncbi:MAG: heat-shock protein Hsp70 [Oscillatoriales cyanobacterium CG2_30_44_21]|nr:MAG: heat-shock protein Hsp70 [Oscillatoriales cyanobacterium CG2_30_44_21]
MKAIAIDFGSSNTVIAKWNIATNQPETISLEGVNRPAPWRSLVPSLVYVQNAQEGTVEIGQRTIDLGKSYPQPRLFCQIKRRLTNNVRYNPKLDGIKITPEWLGSRFLSEIFQNLRSHQIFPLEIILTAPVQAYEKYLRWLEECSTEVFTSQSATPRIRILDEPTAAALGYGVGDDAIAPNALVLVIDFGGGTLDLALVRLPQNANVHEWGDRLGVSESIENKAQVLAKTGYTVGGEDIDQWLVQDYLENNQGREIGDSLVLKQLMERIKISLSEVETVTEVFFDLNTQTAHEISYTRPQLEQILEQKGFYRILQTAINELINRAFNKGILKGDIKHILLVGGCALIPSVTTFVENYFSMGKVYSHKPFEAIAHGALMISQGMDVQDYLFHSYAIRYWDRALQNWKYQPLFQRGQTYPTRRPVEMLLRASQPNQAEIELTIGELESRANGAAEVIFTGDRLVMQFDQRAKESFEPLSVSADGEGIPQAIAKLDPLGQPNEDRLKVLFQVSENRELLITAIDILTHQELLKNHPVAKLR